MLKFGEFTLDPGAHRLLRAGAAVDVQPKVVDLLELLVSEPGRLWTREELHERLWPGVYVTEASLSQTVRKLRDALGDDAQSPRFLETIPRRGYRFVGEVAADDAPVPRPRSRPPVFHDAPVGRDAVLEAAREQLASARVVTLLGPGGIGKTRLAVALAEGAEAAFCELAPCATPADVLSAVADALGLVGPGRPEERVPSALRDGVLLVLDNAEHVAEAVAAALASWLAGAPAARFLVTSRVRLGLAAERCLEVPPLAPADAVALYRSRAAAVRPEADDPLAEVEALVAAVDGLPLAIELAAARRRVLSASDVRARLERGEDVLSRPRADRPDRQASMRAVAAWSWGLLTPAEREACARCAVFRGGFTVGAAEAAGIPLDHVEALRDHSWLVQRGDRLDLYEVLRAFAEDQLGALRAEADAAHVRVCVELAGALRDQPTARLAAERHNLRAALGRTSDPALRARLALGLARIDRYGRPEAAITAIDDALGPQAAAEDASRSALLAARADLRFLDHPQLGLADAREAVALAPDDTTRAEALRILAQCASVVGERDLEAQALDEALTLWRSVDDRRGEALTLRTAGARHTRQGDFVRAYACFRESARGLADAPWEEARTLVRVGRTALVCQDLHGAHDALQRALEVLHPRLDAILYTEVVNALGTLAWFEDRLDDAERLFAEASALARAARDRRDPRVEIQRARLAATRGDPALARTLLQGVVVDGPFLRAEWSGAWSWLHIAEGAVDRAEAIEAERRDQFTALGYAAGAGASATFVALLAARAGRVADARAASEAARALFSGSPGSAFEQYGLLAGAAVHRAALAAGDRGAIERVEEAIASIQALCSQGTNGRAAMAPDIRLGVRLLRP